MIRRVAALLGVALTTGIAVPGVVGAQGRHGHDGRANLPPLLRRSIENTSRQRYIGTRVVEFRRGGTSNRHEETITRDGSLVRVEFPAGSPLEGQVIVENQFERRHYFPGKNEIHLLPPRREEATGRLERIGGQGKFHWLMGSPANVVGYHAEQVMLVDKDGNVAQRIFIEPESGVILKRQFFDAVGTSVGGFEFVKIDLTPRIDRSVFRLQRKGARIVTPADILDDLAKKNGFLPLALPATSGFRLEGSNVRKIDNQDVLLQFYGSGGGKRLTLFQVKAVLSADRLHQYATREGLRFVYWQAQGKTFVLVGNLDQPTLLRLAGPVSGGTATGDR